MKYEGGFHYHDEEPAPAACPCCGKTLDAATKMKGDGIRAPKAGDLGLCFYCTTVLVYVDDRFVREAEPEEIPEQLAAMAQKIRNAKERPSFILVGCIVDARRGRE